VVFDPFEASAGGIDTPFVSISTLPLNVAGQPGLWGYSVFPPTGAASTNAFSALIINKVAVFMFALPWRVQLNKVTVFIVGGSLSTTGAVGIYYLNVNPSAYPAGVTTSVVPP